jgi:hypothetical protein
LIPDRRTPYKAEPNRSGIPRESREALVEPSGIERVISP